jgi:molybdopterin molybdotransferase
MDSFFNVKTPQEVFRIIEHFGPSGEETVSLEDSLGRILARDIISDEDLPHFSRSVVDGFAVRAKDTFGASESLPAFFEIAGEVQMGQSPAVTVAEGQAVRISTGGMLPEGTDGAVMIEHCMAMEENTIAVSRPISPLENIIQPGDDFKRGESVINHGHCLRPQDLGVLAGLGKGEIPVFKKPRVAIISTGDEIVSIDEHPAPGQVRDINSYTLAAFCRRNGAEPLHIGLCSDSFDTLKKLAEEGLNRADTVWISGGSSVGTRDLTLKVFETLADFSLLVHGISISPGKPTIIGISGSIPVIGLPGHVASALVVADVFLTPLLFRLSGRSYFSGVQQPQAEAILARNIESASGREDYIRVRLIREPEGLIAEPIFGKSGLISTLVEADGLVRVDMNTEGLYKGQLVKVLLTGGMI